MRLARQAGLTLVELMVALTIGLFLTLGLMLMMSDTSRTFKIQDDYARMQENAVSALRYVSESLRHTGFYGLMAETGTLAPYGTIGAITNDCGNTFTTTVPIFGYEALTTSNVNATVPCIKAVNFQAGPVLITRLTTGLPVTDPNADGNFADGILLQAGYENTLYVQSNVRGGVVLKGSDFNGFAASLQVRKFADGRQFPVFPYQLHTYYIRPCSRPTGGGASDECLATDDNGRPVPTLVRQELQGTAMVERPLAEGIERMNLLYGLDMQPAPDGDGVADRFTADPLAIAGDGWARVVAVRVTLLARSPTPIAGYDDSSKSYDLNGDGTPDFTCTVNTIECAYKRAIFSQVIQVRNLAYRRGA
jgi:type IV pilus assembly protein PilW